MREGMSRAADTAREYASDVGKTLSDTADSVGKTLSEKADRVGQTLSETADRYVSAAGEYAEDARQTIMDQSSRIAGQAQSMIERIVREQPLAVAIAGLAAGAAVAATFPATRFAWDPERFLAPYANWFVEEFVAYSRQKYPKHKLIRRAPPLPRPKEPTNRSSELNHA
jgi:ElaB/YqjD/DUF883 family membrane-anchored ribosome-binding protein